MVDMAHFAGLVATGLYADPFPHARCRDHDNLQVFTRRARPPPALEHKALSNKINHGIFLGVLGSVLLHGVAGNAACLGEALRPEFKLYNQAVLDNAWALAATLGEAGFASSRVEPTPD